MPASVGHFTAGNNAALKPWLGYHRRRLTRYDSVMIELSLIHALPEPPWQALDLKAARAQLASLATLPAQLAANQVGQWLAQWQRAALAPAERLALLQTLQAPVTALAVRLESGAARQELSCTPEARAGLHSARQLLRQWHEQCKLLAQAFSAQEASRFASSRPRQEALHWRWPAATTCWRCTRAAMRRCTRASGATATTCTLMRYPRVGKGGKPAAARRRRGSAIAA